MNLDVNSPHLVWRALLEAADAYRESAELLVEAWQDPSAGREWSALANVLEAAAERARRISPE